MEGHVNEELVLEELKEIKTDVKSIKDCLYPGNGKPGLCARVGALEQFIGAVKRLSWLCIGGILTIVTAAIAFNVFHIKL